MRRTDLFVQKSLPECKLVAQISTVYVVVSVAQVSKKLSQEGVQASEAQYNVKDIWCICFGGASTSSVPPQLACLSAKATTESCSGQTRTDGLKVCIAVIGSFVVTDNVVDPGQHGHFLVELAETEAAQDISSQKGELQLHCFSTRLPLLLDVEFLLAK